MRLPLQLFFRNGQLWRRYLSLSTCRLGLLATTAGPSLVQPTGSLLCRGLALG